MSYPTDSLSQDAVDELEYVSLFPPIPEVGDMSYSREDHIRTSSARKMAENMRDYEAMRGNSLANEMSDKEVACQMANEATIGDEYAVTLNAEMVAKLNADRLELQDMPHSWQPTS